MIRVAFGGFATFNGGLRPAPMLPKSKMECMKAEGRALLSVVQQFAPRCYVRLKGRV